MGISERKEREKAERSAFIMDCAKELILEHGVDLVSMNDIAQKAELSKATLYLYYDSKEILFEAIVAEQKKRFLESVRARIKDDVSGLEAIKALWRSYLAVFGESEDIIVMFSIKNPSNCAIPDDRVNANRTDSLYELIKQVLERGVADGSFDPSLNTGMLARAIIIATSGIVENMARLPRTARKTYLIVEEMRNIFQIILRGLAREGIDRSLLVFDEEGD